MSRKPSQAQKRKNSNNNAARRQSRNQTSQTAPSASIKTGANHSPKPHGEPDASTKRLRTPWITGITAMITGIGIFVPDNWVFIWTRDPSPPWAQPLVLLVGLLALSPFVDCLVATQILAAAENSTTEDRKLWRAVCDKILLFVAVGILSGTLYALYNLDGSHSDVKVINVIADLATVGGILGVFACIPYSVKMIISSLARLRIINRKYWTQVITVIGVIEFLTGYKTLYLLPFILHPFA
jgi:hypothetical protein